MAIDLDAAHRFLTSHARLLDRRRFDWLVSPGDPDTLLAAVDAYRNPDGGYGSGLEADLRHGSSQPGAALHAFEAFAEIGPLTTDRSRQLCDWLESCALDDGGVPFALPIDDPTACSPFWVDADPTVSSAQITTAVTWAAFRVARHDRATATHRWLNRSVDYCLRRSPRLATIPTPTRCRSGSVHGRRLRARAYRARHDRTPHPPPAGGRSSPGGRRDAR